ncbi:MAG: SoxR reducing system RseC family protein [Thauera sp.]
MQARARVLKVERGQAWLRLSEHTGGCGRCDEPGGCRSVQITHAFGLPREEFALPTDLPLKPGDSVVISIPDGAPLRAAFASYGLATVLLLLGAALGSQLGAEGRADLFGFFGAVLGLTLAWAINRVLPRSRSWRNRLRLELAPEGAFVQTLSPLPR